MITTDNATPFSAIEYDENVRKVIPFYDTIHQEILDVVRTINPNPKVWLDTGCGVGSLVERAVLSFPETQFFLTDPARGMLQQAQARLLKSAPGRIHFLSPIGTDDLSSQDFPAPEVITAVLCHHYLPSEKRRRATQVCHQVLKPTGVYITVENTRPFSETGISIGLNRWKHIQISQGRGVEEVEKHARRLDQEYFPITPQAHLDLLAECGFSTRELFWYAYMQAAFYAIKS